MNRAKVRDLLERYADTYNRPGFIAADPISIPHAFDNLQDREIMGFFAAILAWGQRITTINKCRELAALMDDAPYDFIRHHAESDLRRMTDFKHRTFQATDLLYFISFFRAFYREHDSLEAAFVNDEVDGSDFSMKAALSGFHDRFFDADFAPARTRKHIATPARKSACKRLNMFLRWMVRSDDRGVDFGIWKRIPMSALHCPLDVHVERSARKLGLLKRKKRDWRAVEELTTALRKFDPDDPVRYDFALFGMGLEHAL